MKDLTVWIVGCLVMFPLWNIIGSLDKMMGGSPIPARMIAVFHLFLALRLVAYHLTNKKQDGLEAKNE